MRCLQNGSVEKFEIVAGVDNAFYRACREPEMRPGSPYKMKLAVVDRILYAEGVLWTAGKALCGSGKHHVALFYLHKERLMTSTDPTMLLQSEVRGRPAISTIHVVQKNTANPLLGWGKY